MELGAGGNGVGVAGDGGSAGDFGGSGHKPAFCSLEAEPGPCEAAMRRYFYNSESGRCESFIYGGCDGNENNFKSFVECERTCGSSDLDSCSENTDCRVVAAGCCGSTCGTPTLDDVIAVNVDAKTFRELQRCDLVGCPTIYCEPRPPTERPDSYLGAVCESGRCKAVDLSNTAVTACSSAADCTLRHGVRCCESCSTDNYDLVSVNEAALLELVCPSEPAECPPCVPTAPEEYAPDCVDGRCILVPISE